MNQVLEFEPSARFYALWENEKTYTDSLGTVQRERNFMTGRASIGTKATYLSAWSKTVTIAPYMGIYADYYFTKDDAEPTSFLPEFLHGFSTRFISGIALKKSDGTYLALGGELGGLGSDVTIWSVRGRAAIPF